MNTYAVIGLGYVGLGLATALAKKNATWGYDLNSQRIQELKHHLDRNHLIEPSDLQQSSLVYTDQLEDIRHVTFYIITVSTPAYFYEMPNLKPLTMATEAIATLLKPGDMVVFESTVYPGTTEEVCIPILEQHSGLKNGVDFSVGYSPERINPSDADHTLSNTPKIIAAQSQNARHRMQEVYETVCETTYPVPSISIAESIKILENTQRDVNIALMNEFTMIMHALNIDMHEVLKGAKTKWNFAPYTPGLVGGHCISIDPLYLAFKAKRHNVQTDLLLTARKINDGITGFILQLTLRTD